MLLHRRVYLSAARAQYGGVVPIALLLPPVGVWRVVVLVVWVPIALLLPPVGVCCSSAGGPSCSACVALAGQLAAEGQLIVDLAFRFTCTRLSSILQQSVSLIVIVLCRLLII